MPTDLIRDPRTFSTTSISRVDFNNDETISDFVEHRWQQRERSRGRLERQWFTQVAYYLGYQYHTYNSDTGMLTLPKAPSWRVRLVCNRLMMVSRKIVSKAMRQKPIWYVVAATGETEDVRVAKAGEKVLKYYWRYLKMGRTLLDFLCWATITGNAFLRVYWDPDKGDEIALDQEDTMGLPPDMQQQLQGMGNSIHLGDLSIEAVSPFATDVDPEAEKLENAAYLIDSRARNVDYLEDRYNVTGLTPDASDDRALSRYYERRIQSMGGLSFRGGDQRDDDEARNCVMTHTLWVNPSRRNPKGFFAVVANNRVLTKGPLPNPFRKIPYIHVCEIQVPGRLWGTCALEQLLSLQADYNRARSQLCENRNLMARPKWLKPMGASISNEALTDQPGEVIEYVYPLKPEIIVPTDFSQGTYKTLEYNLKDMEDLSGIHEVTQARAPSGVRSGIAIAQLQEQDDQLLSSFFQMIEEGLSTIGSWSLQLIAQNVQEERLIKLVGRDKEIEAMTFSGKDLYGPNFGKPGANYFDVDVQMGSQLPLSPTQRKEYAMDLASVGILNPVGDRKRIFEILDMGIDENEFVEDAQDKQNANRENMMIAQGIQLEPTTYDNNEVHFATHLYYQKAPEYAELIQQNPLVHQLMEQHKAAHVMRLQAAMMPPPQVPMGEPSGQGNPPAPELPQAPGAAPSIQESGGPPQISGGM